MHKESRFFERSEFKSMFESELRRSYKNCIERHCEGNLPKVIKIYMPSNESNPIWMNELSLVNIPAENILEIDEALDKIFRDDGLFPEWVNISPFAVTERETIFEVVRSEEWTNEIFVDSQFPVEPFQLRGPALPVGWRPDHAIPKVNLPRLEVIVDA